MRSKMFKTTGFSLAVVMLIIAGAFLSGCVGSNSQETDTNVETLNIGLIPTEDAIEMMEKFGPVESYLEDELNMEVEVFTATDYTSVIEAMRSGKIDVAYFGPFSYILAAEQAGAEAIIAGGENGEVGSYTSCIITHPDSGITDLDDLFENAGEVTFSFVDPASTSGNLIPRGFLLSEGLDPDKDFEESIFAGGHDASGLAVKAKKVDAGAIYTLGYERMIEEGIMTEEDAFIIWESDPIPCSPIAVRGELEPEVKQKIQQAFIDLPDKNPEAMEVFESQWEGNAEYVAVEDSTYEFIRTVASGLGYI
ncbi:MAG: phosphonate transport system substrate-binding protein [Methanolobus sp.]|nr:phosphonate transport system substrate-binding protein [Methanolobus sp.]